jgi:hypothetical protein
MKAKPKEIKPTPLPVPIPERYIKSLKISRTSGYLSRLNAGVRRLAPPKVHIVLQLAKGDPALACLDILQLRPDWQICEDDWRDHFRKDPILREHFRQEFLNAQQ